MTEPLRAAIEANAECGAEQRTEASAPRVEALCTAAFQLPIGRQTHDGLVSEAVKLIEQAEKDAYRQGMYAGAHLALDFDTADARRHAPED